MSVKRIDERVISELKNRLPEVRIKMNMPMSEHTSFKIGGEAAVMLFPSSEEGLTGTLAVLRELEIEPLIAGRGTNLLVEDGALDIAVVKTSPGVGGISLENGYITVSSGVTLTKLAAFAAEHSLAGLEFAHGIPGSVGGGIYMNAGAYGGELGNFVTSVTAVKNTGETAVLSGGELSFSYRHSVFSDTPSVITRAVLKLPPGGSDEIGQKMKDFAKRRAEAQPLDKPSAGSAFKRPENGYAAALIDEAGLKGYRIGGAAVSEKHAGFIVNLGGAVFNDVYMLMEHVREVVAQRTGIELVPEIKIVRGT